jgi:hypothetical protein
VHPGESSRVGEPRTQRVGVAVEEVAHPIALGCGEALTHGVEQCGQPGPGGREGSFERVRVGRGLRPPMGMQPRRGLHEGEAVALGGRDLELVAVRLTHVVEQQVVVGGVRGPWRHRSSGASGRPVKSLR